MDAKGPKRTKKSAAAEPSIRPSPEGYREEAAKPARRRRRPGKARDDIPDVPKVGPTGELADAEAQRIVGQLVRRLMWR